MKTDNHHCISAGLLALFAAPILTLASTDSDTGYFVTKLVSDIATNAAHLDPHLVDPWGIVAGPDVVWVNDNGAGLTTAYNPAGKIFSFAIKIPGSSSAGTNGGMPSGLVFNDTHQFLVSNTNHALPATFLAATEDGTIVAWNQAVNGDTAAIVVNNSYTGAVYKGLAIVRDTNGSPRLYAANFHAGVVEVFDGQFNSLFSFTDTNVPAGFAPFGIRQIHGAVFVTFALQKTTAGHDDQPGPGNGYVDIFNMDGVLLRRMASQGPLNSPWGLAVAPRHFGKFKNTLLVGNAGDGRINAYDLLTGQPLGNLIHSDGTDIVIPGLWGLSFEEDDLMERDCDTDAHRLYFSAGINNESDGLLGLILPAD